MLSPARRASVTTALALLAAALLVANLVKRGVVSEAFFARHEKTIDGTSTLLGAAALVAGAVASYFRFFKGRTFATRAELSIAVAVIPATSGQHLHAITVRLKNIGPVPLWDPRIRLRMQDHSAAPAEPAEIQGWRLEHGAGDDVAVVDSQECALYHAERLVHASVWAVRYEAAVRTPGGDTWFAMTTIANAPSTKAPADG